MICFRDMTFCGSDCINSSCSRHFGDTQIQEAREWWGGGGAPIASADFSKDCEEYMRDD